MRITSRRHDFYDIVQRQAMDTTVVYPRYGFPPDEDDDTLYEHPHADPKEKVWCRALQGRFTVPAPSRQYFQDAVIWSYPVVIGFAGVLYPLVVFGNRIAYKMDEYTALRPREDLRRGYYPWRDIRYGRSSRTQQFFAKEGFERLNGVFAEYNVPIFVIEALGMRELQGSWGLSINRILNPFEFYRQVDPYTAFQNLQMYITGVLRQPVGPVGNIPDEYQILKKGFDPVTSFRKAPGGKKRRKRKKGKA